VIGLCQLTPPQNVAWVVSRTPAQQLGSAECGIFLMPAMNAGEIAQIYEQRHGRSPTMEELEWLSARSGGNPRNAIFLGEALAAQKEAGVPKDVNAFIEKSIEALEVEPRLILEVVALCREPVKYDLILHATAQNFRALDAHLEKLALAGFLEHESLEFEQFRLCHAVYRKILLKNLPVRTERRLRERLLSHLEAQQPTLECIRHLAALGRSGEAFEQVAKVSELQKQQGLQEDALTTLRTALLDLQLSEEEVLSLKCRLAQVLLELDNLEDATSLIEEVPDEDLGLETSLRRALVLIRLSERRRSDPGKHLPAFGPLLRPPKEEDRSLTVVELMVRLALLMAEVEYRAGESEEAARHYLFAKKLTKNTDLPRLECLTELEEGRFRLRTGDLAAAEICARRVVEVSKTTKGSRYHVEGLILLGDCQAKVGGRESAEKSYKKAQNVARSAALDRHHSIASLRLKQLEEDDSVSESLAESSAEAVEKPKHLAETPEEKETGPGKKRKGKVLLLTALVSLLLAGSYAGYEYFRMSGTLKLTTTPQTVLLFANGETTPLTLNSGEDLKLPPGKHNLRIEAEGYRFQTTSVDLERGKTEELAVALEPLPGKLQLTVQPADATVAIDGKEYATDALSAGLELEPGTYPLKIQAERYHPQEETIEVKPGGMVERTFSLEPLPGKLTLAVTPADAIVEVDDKEYAPDALSAGLELEPGTYVLKVRKENYHPQEETIEVKPGEALEKTLALRRTLGDLKVLAKPDKATIWLDGKKLEKGSGELIADLKPGEHTLKVSKEGWKSNQQKVKIEEGKVATVEVELELEQKALPPVNNPPPVQHPVHQPVHRPSAPRPASGGSGGLPWE
jgi:tetratricopeptide (TPR) repeat protein